MSGEQDRISRKIDDAVSSVNSAIVDLTQTVRRIDARLAPYCSLPETPIQTELGERLNREEKGGDERSEFYRQIISLRFAILEQNAVLLRLIDQLDI